MRKYRLSQDIARYHHGGRKGWKTSDGEGREVQEQVLQRARGIHRARRVGRGRPEREVMEETGIRVKNIKYFGSQPWPFPDSLMIAFTAQYESGEIAVDGREILDAGWFLPSEIPPGPGPMSVARKLIDWFVQSEGGGVL